MSYPSQRWLGHGHVRASLRLYNADRDRKLPRRSLTFRLVCAASSRCSNPLVSHDSLTWRVGADCAEPDALTRWPR